MNGAAFYQPYFKLSDELEELFILPFLEVITFLDFCFESCEFVSLVNSGGEFSIFKPGTSKAFRTIIMFSFHFSKFLITSNLGMSNLSNKYILSLFIWFITGSLSLSMIIIALIKFNFVF